MYDAMIVVVAVVCLIIPALIIFLHSKNLAELKGQLSGIEIEVRGLSATISGIGSRLLKESELANIHNSAVDNKIGRIQSSTDFLRSHLSTYLGDGISVTYLLGDIPIYVNANDDGVSANLINGGDYEPNILKVILSFLTPYSSFLDVGANLGFYTITVGEHIKRTKAKIYSFEPNSAMFDLMNRSVYLNGLSSYVTTYSFGLAAKDELVSFGVPVGVAGGGRAIPQALLQSLSGNDRLKMIQVKMRRLDEVVADDFICDIIKIDVEGAEDQVLLGMSEVVRRSNDLKIVLEKLDSSDIYNHNIWNFIQAHDLNIYLISPNSYLLPLADYNSFCNSKGYILASKCSLADNLDRDRLSIFPEHLFAIDGKIINGALVASVKDGHTVFYGPYWPLRAGPYKARIDGEITGELQLTIAERFGQTVMRCNLADKQANFYVDRDLTMFECVARAYGGPASVAIRRIDLSRMR